MWRASTPRKEDLIRIRAARLELDLHPLAIHVSYLINLASVDPVIREKSIAGFRGELERAILIGAEYLVIHPGNYKDRTVEHGIYSFVEGMAEAAAGLPTANLTVLLENTVGSGAQIGSKLIELRAIRELLASHKKASSLPVGYCLDTCHLLAAGFDIANAAGLNTTVAEVDHVLGLDHVKMIHANDSKGALGSHLDRHANIGEGHIGEEGFRRILTHAKLRDKPFVLETPVDREGDDRRNVEALQRLSLKRKGRKK